MKTINITPHFTWHDAFFLPKWGIYHAPTEIEIRAIQDTCRAMEEIRRDLGDRPINVHCMIRPSFVICHGSEYHGKDYNAAVGSTAKHSPHVYGQACDFDISGMTCDDVRAHLVKVLDVYDIRVEDRPGSNWTHLDTYPPSVSGGRRFFKP